MTKKQCTNDATLNKMTSGLSLSRRKLLVAVGGVAALGGVGYAGARSVAREGVINGRLVTGCDTDNGTVVDTTDVLHEYIDPDGVPDRRVHPDYRQAFPAEPPMTVSVSFHRKLSREFDDVDYNLSQSCPDERCSTPAVSRQDFNGARLGKNSDCYIIPETARRSSADRFSTRGVTERYDTSFSATGR